MSIRKSAESKAPNKTVRSTDNDTHIKLKSKLSSKITNLESNKIVTAIVVSDGNPELLVECLKSIINQSKPVNNLAIVFTYKDEVKPLKHQKKDVTRKAASSSTLSLSPEIQKIISQIPKFIDVQTTRIPKAKSFGSAIDKLVFSEEFKFKESDYFWLFHDDSYTDEDSLKMQFSEAVKGTVGIVGLKQINPKTNYIEEVGYTISKNFERTTLVGYEEIDQGQYDSREDVFAIGITGALVDSKMFFSINGFDEIAGTYGESLDFCYKAHIAGYRILVAPKARIYHYKLSYYGVRDIKNHNTNALKNAPRSHSSDEVSDFDTLILDNNKSLYKRRQAIVYLRMKYTRLLIIPFYIIIQLLLSPFKYIVKLFNKQPLAGFHQIIFAFENFAILPVVLFTKSRLRKIKKAAPAKFNPKPMFATKADLKAIKQDVQLLKTYKEYKNYLPNLTQLKGIRNLASIKHNYLAAALILTSLFSLIFLSANSINVFNYFSDPLSSVWIGPNLLGAYLGYNEFLKTFLDGSIPSGFGFGTVLAPSLSIFFVLATIFAGMLKLAIGVILILAIPISCFTFWVTSGVITRSIYMRFCASIIWSISPVFLNDIISGKVNSVIAYIIIPLLLFTFMKAFGFAKTDFQIPIKPTANSYAAFILCFGLLMGVAPNLFLPITFIIFLITTTHKKYINKHRRVYIGFSFGILLLIPVIYYSFRLIHLGGLKLFLASNDFPNNFKPQNLYNSIIGNDSIFTGTIQDLPMVIMFSIITIIFFVASNRHKDSYNSKITNWIFSILIATIFISLISSRIQFSYVSGEPVYFSIANFGILINFILLIGICLLLPNYNPFAIIKKNTINRWLDTNSEDKVIFKPYITILLLLSIISASVFVFFSSQISTDLKLHIVNENYLIPTSARKLQQNLDSPFELVIKNGDEDEDFYYTIIRSGGSEFVDYSPVLQFSDYAYSFESEGNVLIKELVSQLAISPNTQTAQNLANLGINGIVVTGETLQNPNAPALVESIDLTDRLESVIDNENMHFWRITAEPEQSNMLDNSDSEFRNFLYKLWIIIVFIYTISLLILMIPIRAQKMDGVYV